jgi:predicted ATPase with chaperone activity
MSSHDSSDNEATRTLVGARPIKMVDTENDNLDDLLTPREHTPLLVEALRPTDTPLPLPISEPTQKARTVPARLDIAFQPEPPRSIAATGLPPVYVEELCLKHLYQASELRGGEISRRSCLPPVVIEEVMERLRVNRMVDIKGTRGVGIGRTQTVFTLTKTGQRHCELALERDRYTGPAPVPLATYREAVAAQTIRGNRLSRKDLEPRFADLILEEGVFEALGPAMNGGRSLFVYGPSGNGKTSVCQRMIGCFGGKILVPHAVWAGDFVIKIFDDSFHTEIPMPDDGPLFDERWVCCARPLVVVGGDLTLKDLDLRYSDEVKYYEAPVQVKANGGVLMIDDFGRQRVSPRALLNRWIVPLENEYDFLVTHTGMKLRLPFDVFVIFSTNLDPATLVDEAFLRRVRYKLEMARPDEERYRKIFRAECRAQNVPWSEDLESHLVQQHYRKPKRPFNACEPRDLLAQVRDLCAYRKTEVRLDREIIDRVVANYFVKF